MKNFLLGVFRKYNFDYSSIDFNLDYTSIVSRVENELLCKSYPISNARLIMAELWRKQKLMNIENIKNTILKNTLEEILKDNTFSINSTFIERKKRILCYAIKTIFGFHILTKDQAEKIERFGYGINSYRIEIGETIRDIYCNGKHPNLSPTTGSFCIDNDLRNIPFSYDNILLVEDMLSKFNMVSCFLEKAEYDLITGVIEDV